MNHDISVFVIESVEDMVELAEDEIYEFVIDGDECANCGMILGIISTEDMIIPCIVVSVEISALDPWTICLDCAAPLLYPQEWSVDL